MLIIVDGKIRAMTQEEMRIVQEIARMPKPEPTPEERIAALEEQLKAAKILLGVE